MPKLDSALAAGISSWRTVRGIRASRLGRCRAPVAVSSPATTKITAMLGSSRNALTISTAVSTPWPTPVHTSSRRRSTWSARAPPHSPNTTSGTSSTSPIAPTAKFEPVRS